jgi:hypothetical protein
MRYFISPFLNSHSFHLIVGDARVGKTTFALQTAAMLLPGAVRPPEMPDGKSYAWGQFPFGGRLAPEESVWYVECLRLRHDVVRKCQTLGIPTDDASGGALRLVTVDEIVDARGTHGDESTPTFAEVLKYVTTQNGGVRPAILIIDGISMILPTSKEKQHEDEAKWFRDAARQYFKSGGTLIGVQMHKKGTGSVVPGTHALSGSLSSVVEVRLHGKKKTHPNYRVIEITGSSFSRRTLTLEFLRSGALASVVGGVEVDQFDGQVVGEEMPLSPEMGRLIESMAVGLSAKDQEMRFQVAELAEICEEKGLSSRRSVFRWLTIAKLSKRVMITSVRGWYRLVPAPSLN